MDTTIELECPSCKEELEIDAGFAGGVCRCFNCGSLMTVPALDAAAPVQRSARPDAPSGTQQVNLEDADEGGQASASAASEEKAGGSARPDAPGRPASPQPMKTAAKPELIEAVNEADGTYTTQSGRQVAAGAVPMARRKKTAMKVGVIAVFILIVASLVGVSVAAVMFLVQSTQPEPEPDVREVIRETRGGYDPDQNPFDMAEANMLGVRLTGDVVLVVDASGISQQWLGLAGDAVVDAAVKSGVSRLQVLYLTESGVVAWPDAMKAIDGDTAGRLRTFVDDRYTSGRAPLAAGMTAAAAAKPDQIVLVTSQTFDATLVATLEKALAGAPRASLDVITIDSDSQAARDWVQETGGRTVDLPISRLTTWYRTAEMIPGDVEAAPLPTPLPDADSDSDSDADAE